MSIQWCLYTERAVGQGHPSYADVINRPLKNLLTIQGYGVDEDGPYFRNVGDLIPPSEISHVGEVGQVAFVITRGDPITTGPLFNFQMPFPGTWTGWTLVAPYEDGSIVLDIWKDTYALIPPTVADSITAAAKPTIAAARKASSVALTGWTLPFTGGLVGASFIVNVDSVTAFTGFSLIMSFTRT